MSPFPLLCPHPPAPTPSFPLAITMLLSVSIKGNYFTNPNQHGFHHSLTNKEEGKYPISATSRLPLLPKWGWEEAKSNCKGHDIDLDGSILQKRIKKKEGHMLHPWHRMYEDKKIRLMKGAKQWPY